MAEHTPTPWRYSNDGRVMAGNLTVCDLMTVLDLDEDEEIDATGEFIVLACNSHADLLAVCEALVAWRDVPAGPDDERDGFHALNDVVEAAIVAIAKAKPQT